jgi:type IV pilus assembly protein PilF
VIALPVIGTRWLLAPAMVLMLTACVGTERRLETDLGEAARLNTQMGMDYMRRGRDDLAEEKLLRAMEQDRRYAPAYATYALWLVRQDLPDEAEAHYRTAVRLDGNDPDTRNNFGAFLCSRGHKREAVEQLMIAANNPRYPGRVTALNNAARCIREDDPEAAERYLRRALEISNEDPEALAQLAWVSYKQGEYLRVRAFISRFEAVSQHTAETLRIAAQTEAQLGDAVAADGYRRRYNEQFPDAARRNPLN